MQIESPSTKSLRIETPISGLANKQKYYHLIYEKSKIK